MNFLLDITIYYYILILQYSIVCRLFKRPKAKCQTGMIKVIENGRDKRKNCGKGC
jgi:hypothetical protein